MSTGVMLETVGHTYCFFTGRSGIVTGITVTADNQPIIKSHTQDSLSLARTEMQPKVVCMFLCEHACIHLAI